MGIQQQYELKVSSRHWQYFRLRHVERDSESAVVGLKLNGCFQQGNSAIYRTDIELLVVT